MRKLVMIASAAMIALSCSGDDDSGTVNASIEGTWDLTAFDISEGIDLNGDGTASTSIISEASCYGNSRIVFNDDNTATLHMDELDIDIQITGEQDYEYVIDCIDSESETIEYSVDDDSVTLHTGDETVSLEREGNTLRVVIPEIITIPDFEGGEIIYTNVSATLEFTKQ